MIIPVNLGELSYDIVLQNGALNSIGKLVNLDRKVLVVTDSGVPHEYAETVAAQCKDAVIATIPQGEASKCFDTLEDLLKKMLKADFTRKDCVVAVGGGVVGDLSGFTASCYMRGIDFYNVPTTLLSQVDSSIGGKTAIDFEGVKNIIGAFYQPKKVIIDPEVLKTLDERQLHAGLAEAIKMSATSDKELFEFIESSSSLEADLPTIIEKALLIKKAVVEQDPKETGLRKVLNFGHTIGHAVESFSEGELLHGECVALGMLPLCSQEASERIKKVLEKYSLPTAIKQTPSELLPFIIHDKKRQKDGISVVYVDTIGEFRFQCMEPQEILDCLESLT